MEDGHELRHAVPLVGGSAAKFGFKVHHAARRAAQLELVHHQSSQVLKDRNLTGRYIARLTVEHTHGAKVVPVGRPKRGAGIKAQPHCAGDQRVAHGNGVEPSITNDRWDILHDGRGAQARFAGDPVHVYSKAPRKKDPVVVNDRHDCDGSIEDPRCYCDNVLECSIRRQPRHVVTPKGGEPLGLRVAGFLRGLAAVYQITSPGVDYLNVVRGRQRQARH